MNIIRHSIKLYKNKSILTCIRNNVLTLLILDVNVRVCLNK
jgi:hypothetical protein